MDTSILNTIKKMLGLDSSYTAFDTDIIVHINSAMAILAQIGLTSDVTCITGSTETWAQYLGTATNLELVKSYIYLKVRTVFDPSASSSIQKAFEERISELEWRISTTVDHEVVDDE